MEADVPALPENYFATENLEAWDLWLAGVLEVLPVMAAAPVERTPESAAKFPQGCKDLLERCELSTRQFQAVNRAQLMGLREQEHEK